MANMPPPAVAGLLGLDQGLRPGKFVDEGLNFVGRAFLDQEVEDDADGFFRGGPIDADIGDETRDQFVHDPPQRSRTGGGLSLY